MRSRFIKVVLVLKIVFDSCLERLPKNVLEINDNINKHSKT